MDVYPMYLIGMFNSGGSHQLARTLHSLVVEIGYPNLLFGNHQALHQCWILGSDARWTGIRVAFQRLDTAERHHHSSCTVTDIGTKGKIFYQVKPGSNLTRGNDFDVTLETESC